MKASLWCSKRVWISTQTHVLTMSMWASTFKAPILNSHGFDTLFYTEIQEHHERTLNPFIIRLSNVSTENAIEWFPWRSWKKTWNQFFYFAKPNERVDLWESLFVSFLFKNGSKIMNKVEKHWKNSESNSLDHVELGINLMTQFGLVNTWFYWQKGWRMFTIKS